MKQEYEYPITDRGEKFKRSILTVSNISSSKGMNQILDGVSFNINFGEHTVLVGPNGAGKTTLMNIVTQVEESDTGSVTIPQDVNVVYVPQSFDKILRNMPDITVLEYFKQANGLDSIESRMRELEVDFLVPSNQTQTALNEYGELQTKFHDLGGYSIESESTSLMNGIGFSRQTNLNTNISKLSGGEKTKLFISQALISNADLLLLDEPSNHLDSRSVAWLANHLRSYKGATLVISHEKSFLKTFAQKVVELLPNQAGAEVYSGDYSSYLSQRSNKVNTLEKSLQKKEKEVSKLDELANRLRAGRNAKISTDRQKKLAKVKLEMPERGKSSKIPNIVFEVGIRSGADVLQTLNLTKKYGGKTINYSNVNLEVRRGEKIAIVGPVGTGKSTLLKIIAGVIKPDSGKIKFGSNVDIGYYSQEMDDLDTNNTVIDELRSISGYQSDQKIRNLLGAFLFQGDDVFKQIEVLSYGERSRLMLAKLAINKHNFLVLDEPTNHLDAISRNAVAEMIKKFEGSVIVVTHDQEFMQKINLNRVMTLT